jgi:hypothetical protein
MPSNNRRPAVAHNAIRNCIALATKYNFGCDVRISIYVDSPPLQQRTVDLINQHSDVCRLLQEKASKYIHINWPALFNMSDPDTTHYLNTGDDIFLSWNTFKVLKLVEEVDLIQPYFIDPDGFVVFKDFQNPTYTTMRFRADLIKKSSYLLHKRDAEVNRFAETDHQFIHDCNERVHASMLFLPFYALHIGYPFGIGQDISAFECRSLSEEDIRQRYMWIKQRRMLNNYERVGFLPFPELFDEENDTPHEHIFRITGQQCAQCGANQKLLKCWKDHIFCSECGAGTKDCDEVRYKLRWLPEAMTQAEQKDFWLEWMNTHKHPIVGRWAQY